MDQELQNMLRLEPVRFEPVNLLRVGVEGAEAKYGAALDENLARASQFIEYLERRGFWLRWDYIVNHSRSMVTVTLGADDTAMVEEVVAARPPLLVDGALYLAAVLVTRSILAGISHG